VREETTDLTILPRDENCARVNYSAKAYLTMCSHPPGMALYIPRISKLQTRHGSIARLRQRITDRHRVVCLDFYSIIVSRKYRGTVWRTTTFMVIIESTVARTFEKLNYYNRILSQINVLSRTSRSPRITNSLRNNRNIVYIFCPRYLEEFD